MVKYYLKQMRGEEFIEKILEGERDFSNMKLEEGFDLGSHESFEELQNYLHKENLKNNPVIINDSEFKYFRARGLYLPFIKGENVDLNYADLEKAYLENADLSKAALNHTNLRNTVFNYANLESATLVNANLENAKFWKANLKNAKLVYAYLENTNLGGGANLENVNLWKANLKNANLSYANLGFSELSFTNLELASLGYADFKFSTLKWIRNLEKSKYLGFANFAETRVTPKEKAIIEEALKERRSLIVEEW